VGFLPGRILRTRRWARASQPLNAVVHLRASLVISAGGDCAYCRRPDACRLLGRSERRFELQAGEAGGSDGRDCLPARACVLGGESSDIRSSTARCCARPPARTRTGRGGAGALYGDHQGRPRWCGSCALAVDADCEAGALPRLHDGLPHCASRRPGASLGGGKRRAWSARTALGCLTRSTLTPILMSRIRPIDEPVMVEDREQALHVLREGGAGRREDLTRSG
jgi:hypothetical protein